MIDVPRGWFVSHCYMQREGFRNPMVECNDAHEPIIAEVYGKDRPYEEKLAIARLMAKALEMKEAIKAAISAMGAQEELVELTMLGDFGTRETDQRCAEIEMANVVFVQELRTLLAEIDGGTR